MSNTCRLLKVQMRSDNGKMVNEKEELKVKAKQGNGERSQLRGWTLV